MIQVDLLYSIKVVGVNFFFTLCEFFLYSIKVVGVNFFFALCEFFFTVQEYCGVIFVQDFGKNVCTPRGVPMSVIEKEINDGAFSFLSDDFRLWSKFRHVSSSPLFSIFICKKK